MQDCKLSIISIYVVRNRCGQVSLLALRVLTTRSRVVQIDDPNLTFFCDPKFIEAQTKESVDLDALLDLYIKSHNDVLVDLPSDLRVGVHLCRGNFPQGVFLGTGTYNKIAAKMFNDLKYDLFYLEYDDIDRIGDFSALRHLPADKAVVLGIVTTKNAELESLDALRNRVFEAADEIAKGQGTSREDALKDCLAVSPQCGFASAAEGFGINMTEDIQWKKLELLRDLAKDIWSH